MAKKGLDKWMLLGYIAAIFNPLPTGIIAGYVLYTEKKYRNTGIAVMVISVVLGIVSLYLVLSTMPTGPGTFG